MERFGVVLVVAFAAGMVCGPLSCVIYSKIRRHRRFRPGPRRLKNARKKLESVAECSSRLGAQSWEAAMARTAGSESEGRAEDQAGPQSGRWPRSPGCTGGERATASLECSICIGPLFPQNTDDGQNASDDRLTRARSCSTQAADNDTDSTILVGRGEPRSTPWHRWTSAVRRHFTSSSPQQPPTWTQPEMTTVHRDHNTLITRWFHRHNVHDIEGGHSGGGEAMHPQAGDEDERVQQLGGMSPSSSTGDHGGDTPVLTKGDGACIGRRDRGTSPPGPGASQDGNVLEGGPDSHAKTAMTPVCVATPSTGGASSAAQASSAGVAVRANTIRHDAQPPPLGQSVTLTAPGDRATGSPPPSGRAAAGPRDADSAGSGSEPAELGRSEPSPTVASPTDAHSYERHAAAAHHSFPRRPMSVVTKAGRGALALTRRVSRGSLTGDGEKDEDVLVLQGCQHAFHARCLVPWFLADGYDCPVCRAPYWMNKERMARALQDERNGVEPEPARPPPATTLPAYPGGRPPIRTSTVYAGMGGVYVVVASPGRHVYATDRRPWEVFIP